MNQILHILTIQHMYLHFHISNATVVEPNITLKEDIIRYISKKKKKSYFYMLYEMHYEEYCKCNGKILFVCKN